KGGSANRNKAKTRLTRLHIKLANESQDHPQKASASLVRVSPHIATEDLNIKNMTAVGGRYKKGLNRYILDSAPGHFFAKLQYKAEEAGTQWSEIPTRQAKPSQTCSCCGYKVNTSLADR